MRLLLLAAALTLCLSTAFADLLNPATDWFHKAGWGVFVHYLTGLQNSRGSISSFGKETAWDEAVRDFDTERFAQTMQDVGANYVVFTVMQISRYMIAPNAAFDRISGYKPGEACATRDLIADLSASLSKRNIRLMLYYTGDGPRGDDKANKGFGFSTPVTADFVDKWAEVAREYSLRYGDKVSGWWVDGCYPWIGYNTENLSIYAKALKAGNPNSIVAFNRGVDGQVMSYTPAEDFTCGEQNGFFDIPVQRFLDGEQWHILSFMGTGWGHCGTKYTKSELGEYVFAVNERGGVVSIDVMLFRDGSLDQSQVEVLKAVRDAHQDFLAGKTLPPVPPGNLAYHKQAKLLSHDGTRTMPINSGICFPRLGVDGNLESTALAGEEWNWTYEVDLIDTVPIHRVKVTFGSGYATAFEVRVSPDGQTWQTVASETGYDGGPYEKTFDPAVEGRFIRVVAMKPDGPDQRGGQMSIAELEVYR